MLAHIQDKVSTFVFEVYLHLYLLILRLGIFFRQHLVYRSSPAFRNPSARSGTILLLGDGLAEGVGDGLSQGGLARRVTRLLQEHADLTKLRFVWEAVTAGRLHTTSADWLPAPAPGGPRPAARDATSLFRSALVTGPFARAKVVVVVVGSHDDIDDSDGTVRNVAQIADAAARLGKHVLVATIPGFAEPSTDRYLAAQTRNLLLEEAIKALPSAEYGRKGSVSMGPDVQRVLVRGGDVVQTEASFLTLNTLGYRIFSREVHDEVAPLAKRVEWAYWKDRLSLSST